MSSAKDYVKFTVNYIKKDANLLSKFEGKDIDAACKLLLRYAVASAMKGKWKRLHADFVFNDSEIEAECALFASELVDDGDDLILSGSDDLIEVEKVAPSKGSDKSSRTKVEEESDELAVRPRAQAPKTVKEATAKPKPKAKEPQVDESESEHEPAKPRKTTKSKAKVVDESDADEPVKPRKTKVKTEHVEVSEEDKHPAKERKPKKTTTAKEKAVKRKTPFIDGVVDYAKAGFNVRTINRLIKAFEDLEKEHDGDLPGLIVASDSRNTKSALEREVVSWRAINIKIQTVNIVVKYSYTYEGESGENKEGNLDIVKYSSETADEGLIDEEKEMIASFTAYLALYETTVATKNGTPKKWKLNVHNVLDSDLVYKLGALKFEGILDTTHQMPIGNFKIAYDPTEGETLSFREIDYPTIFTLIRYTGDHFTPTKMKNAMKKIYKSRSFIIFHTKVMAAIDDLWEEARSNLEDMEERSATAELWFQILSSVHCKNIIAKGWPARPEFDTMIGELLGEAETRKLFCDELFPICFIFSPLAMRTTAISGMPRAKLEQACVDHFIDASTTASRSYSDCDWAAGALESLAANDKDVFRFWFNKDRFLEDKPKKTTKKAEPKHEEKTDEEEEDAE